MNYWLTVHWPPYEDEDEDAGWRYWVFLSEGYQQAGRDLQPGDRIFIYETLSAPRVRRDERFVAIRRPGRQGIIALVRASGSIEPDLDAEPEIYEDGRELCWRFHAQTQLEREGFLPLIEVRRILDYRAQYYLRIPGGLRKLAGAQFDRLLQEFEKRLKLRDTAFKFVGIGEDKVKDVAECHDSYLAGGLSSV